ncbi:piercer of microtubule wall 2 protein [Labeo rohita]|uniref:piercer of microtubule wall 2 protein n=1 Tax=Labeo rohita TaxID=84645 RepID=UPI0021E27773|nr:piercer of microtubule wall 2 protein [Labeo rohita]
MSNPEHQFPCANAGNPVFSCTIKPGSHTSPEDPALARSLNLMYKTTSSDYGAQSPTFESSPCSYHPISQTFSQHLGLCGMFQDNSFNTTLDHRYVYIPNYKTQFKGE